MVSSGRGAAAVAEEEADDARKELILTTRRIRDMGASGDAVGAVEALASLGKAGITPDVLAITACIVRARARRRGVRASQPPP